jgi:hypothetical protein
VIKSKGSQNDHDDGPGSGADNSGDQQESKPEATGNQGSLLIDVTCTPDDIRYPTDLSLLDEAREVAETLMDAMHPPLRDGFGAKPRPQRRKARQQFLLLPRRSGLAPTRFARPSNSSSPICNETSPASMPLSYAVQAFWPLGGTGTESY